MFRHLILIPFLFILILFYWGCELAEDPNTVVQSQQGLLELSKMLPEGATLESAELFIFVTIRSGQTVNVHRITKDWIETEVTWNDFGGSFESNIEGSFVADGLEEWRSVDITALVQKWLYDSDNYPNFGILLEQGQTPYSKYHSSEYEGDKSLRPKFVLTFTYDGGIQEIIIQRNDVNDVADAFISQLRPDTRYGSQISLYTGLLVANPDPLTYYEKQSLVRFQFPTLPPPPGDGTGTPGYWKNHPEAWPVDVIEIGGIPYEKNDAIMIMGAPEKGNKTFTIFRALVAAKLNVLIGNTSDCVDGTISEADAWMVEFGSFDEKVKGSSEAWSEGEPLYFVLDDYNNGLLCAPHRD